MSDTRVRATRATDLLKADHDRVRELLADYLDNDEESVADRQALFGRLRKELMIHSQIEEDIFYPAIAELGDTDDAEDLVEEAREEHKVVRTLLEELSDLDPEVDEFDARMKQLAESVEQHATREEKEIFPLFGKLERDRRDEILEELRHLKAELAADEDAEDVE